MLSSFHLNSSLVLVGYCLHVVVRASEILKYVLRLGYGAASLHEQMEALNPSMVYFTGRVIIFNVYHRIY